MVSKYIIRFIYTEEIWDDVKSFDTVAILFTDMREMGRWRGERERAERENPGEISQTVILKKKLFHIIFNADHKFINLIIEFMLLVH